MPDKQLHQEMYYRMQLIRRFEEAAEEMYKRGNLPGFIHFYIGEEASGVGVCAALRPDDYITSTHRGHGHLIAKGGRVDLLMAELAGKVTGYCRGKGGTMHAADVKLGILGANGIVGGGLGIATGAGLAAKKKGTGQVAVCFFGDGAANQGLLHEVMNMASLWKIPVIYVCEYNGFAEYTRAEDATADAPLFKRAEAFNIPAVQVDGNDVLAVYQATQEAVARGRTGGGPSFIESRTYRLRGHHVGDVGEGRGYRKNAEVEERWKDEPIGRFRRYLLDQAGWTPGEIDQIDQQVETEIAAAVKFAQESPLPDKSETWEHVYA
ncbi:MAG: thiamine pyrophosphate-dependent dehydrogenase E1 component subunit alpha [Caldilineaceae bacterium]